MHNTTPKTAYEQPLNERVRTFLRLEHLFIEARHHLADPSHCSRSAAIRTTLDILSILARSDQRTEVLKELDLQEEKLAALHNRPGVDDNRLQTILDQIRKAAAKMQALPPNAALFIRDHEFLGSVINRSAIPGGTCGFDLPGFHRWLSLPPERQMKDINYWYRCIEPFEQGIHLIIDLIRDSAYPAEKTADDGVFVHVIERQAQMVRVLVPAGASFYPEISAGKHRCTVRFMQQDDVNKRPEQMHEAVKFRFALCAV